jgi:hypothetical protein
MITFNKSGIFQMKNYKIISISIKLGVFDLEKDLFNVPIVTKYKYICFLINHNGSF